MKMTFLLSVILLTLIVTLPLVVTSVGPVVLAFLHLIKCLSPLPAMPALPPGFIFIVAFLVVVAVGASHQEVAAWIVAFQL